MLQEDLVKKWSQDRREEEARSLMWNGGLASAWLHESVNPNQNHAGRRLGNGLPHFHTRQALAEGCLGVTGKLQALLALPIRQSNSRS